MPISPFSSSALFSAGSASALYAAQGGRVASSRQAVETSLARETESARVQLSTFGRIQSATAGVQSASRQLQETGAQSSAATVRKAAEAFVQAYNDQRAALAQTGSPARTGASAVSTASAANEGRTAVASVQLQRQSVELAPTLREAGIRVERDGSLSVDAAALESAFNANPTALSQALGTVGRAAEATATRQLADNGSIGGAVRNLEARVERLETRQATVESGFDAAQRALEAASRRYGFGAVGAGAYLGIFGL